MDNKVLEAAVAARFTKAERKAIHKQAAADNRTPSSWVRNVILQHLNKKKARA